MEPMVLKADLIRRGWTRTLVDRHLGAPDHEPWRYGGGHYAYFAAERVHQAENREGFEDDFRRAQARREIATKRAAALLRKNLLAASASEVAVPPFDRKTLDANAVTHANAFRFFVPLITLPAPAAILQRISVDYLLFELRRTERTPAGRGKVGAREIAIAVMKRRLHQIAIAYPHLADECARRCAPLTPA